jgi:hypothetical protein
MAFTGCHHLFYDRRFHHGQPAFTPYTFTLITADMQEKNQIQDADLELEPNEYKILIDPILKGENDIVYGSRFLNQKKQEGTLSKWANGFLTWLSNFVFNIHITDMETCYKLVPTNVFQSLILKEQMKIYFKT